MTIQKRMIVPPGKNTATQPEYYDDETGRIVPPPDPRAMSLEERERLGLPLPDLPAGGRDLDGSTTSAKRDYPKGTRQGVPGVGQPTDPYNQSVTPHGQPVVAQPGDNLRDVGPAGSGFPQGEGPNMYNPQGDDSSINNPPVGQPEPRTDAPPAETRDPREPAVTEQEVARPMPTTTHAADRVRAQIEAQELERQRAEGPQGTANMPLGDANRNAGEGEPTPSDANKP